MANHPNRGNIYDQHDKSFSLVSAYVVAKGGERVATIAFKFPADGAGRLYAYVHWLGVEMVRGYAGGYGYDKRSAACSVAAHKMPNLEAWPEATGRDAARRAGHPQFVEGLAQDDGLGWDRRLRDAGFDVWQAV